MTRRDFDGKELDSLELTVDVAPRSTVVLPLPDGSRARPKRAARSSSRRHRRRRGLWFFAEDRDSELAPPAFDATATRTETGYRVEVTAGALVRDLALLVDKVDPDAVVDDMLATLLPGETVVWECPALPTSTRRRSSTGACCAARTSCCTQRRGRRPGVTSASLLPRLLEGRRSG